MQTYELTYIISSQINSEAADTIKNELDSFIQGKEGVILSSDKKGAQPLSYVIAKHASGYFNIVVFQTKENNVKEIKANLDKNSHILRSIVVIKKPVKELRERRTRRQLFANDFDLKRNSSAAETTPFKEPRKEEKVDEATLDKKLDELLGE